MRDISTLLEAAYRQDWGQVERLWARDGVQDVFEAAAVGDLDAVYAFIEADPGIAGRVAADGFTPLHLAAYFGRAELVPVLLESGADPDAVAANGTALRPLHAATAARAPEIVEALLKAGATVDAQQAGGFTPLMAAAKHGDTVSLQLLLNAGAKPDLPANDGSTARSLAVRESADLLP